jgi:hypothetical protein
MLSLVGLVVIAAGIAVASASLRAKADVPRLERWSGALFLAGAALAGLGCPLV